MASDFIACSPPVAYIYYLPFQILSISNSTVWMACMACLNKCPCSGLSSLPAPKKIIGNEAGEWGQDINSSSFHPAKFLRVGYTHTHPHLMYSFYEGCTASMGNPLSLAMSPFSFPSLAWNDKVTKPLLNPRCCTISFLYILIKLFFGGHLIFCWQPVR